MLSRLADDAILAPTRWSSALQSLGESFGARQLHILPSTTASTRRRRCRCPWDTKRFSIAGCATKAHAPDPHVGPYLEQCTYVHKGGSGLGPRTRSLDGGRAQHTSLLSGDGATGEAGVVCGVLFLGRRRQTGACRSSAETTEPVYPAKTPRRLARVGPYLGKIVSLAQKFAAFDAASKLSALERVSSAAVVIDATGRATQMNAACARSAWRGLQPRPGSSGGPRSRQQSPTAAAGFICSAYGARRRSGLCADRRRSGRSALASG